MLLQRWLRPIPSAVLWMLVATVSFALPASARPEPLSPEKASEIRVSAIKAFNESDYVATLRLLEPLLRRHDPEATAWTGIMRALGLGADIDPRGALGRLKTAAKNGNVAAANFLFWMYDVGHGVDIDLVAAAHYRNFAFQNSKHSSRTHFGWFNSDPVVIAQYLPRAFNWNRLHAEADDVTAMYNLGMIYLNGWGVDRDYAQASRWIHRAAEHDHPKALYWVGSTFESGDADEYNPELAVKYYQRAAEQGNSEAESKLGTCYANGFGVLQDDARALKWFRKSAIRGDRDAQSALGTWYRDGRGVDQDLNQAVYWYEEAANRGNIKAQTELGYLYLSSRVIKRDTEKGLSRLFEAADQGSPQANYYLARYYQSGAAGAPDYQEALHYFERAAERGHVDAQLQLGGQYFTGVVTEQNDEKAYYWVKSAADQGSARGAFLLARWYSQGVETGLPEPVADHHHRRGARPLRARREEASRLRHDPQRGEVLGRDQMPEHPLSHAGVSRHAERLGAEIGRGRHGEVGLVTVGLEERVWHRSLQRDESGGVGDARERPQQPGAQSREGPAAQPDAQGERDDTDRREPGCLDESPQPIPDVCSHVAGEPRRQGAATSRILHRCPEPLETIVRAAARPRRR